MPPKKRGAKAKAQPAATKAVAEDASLEDAPHEDVVDAPEELAATVDEAKPEEPAEDAKNDVDEDLPVGDPDAPQPAKAAKPSKKRKQAASTDEPSKSSRRSGRSTKAEPTKQQLLAYLLSDAAAELTRPEDESEQLKSNTGLRTYSSSDLNPWEELLCAVILSRPISHRLGLRTIRTVLNEPYNFSSAKATKDAGHDKHVEAIYEARTQHKDKTAAQIGGLADTVLEKFTSSTDPEGISLYQVREEGGHDMNQEIELLKSSIKGIGTTGLEIFFRRVQWLWPASFPNIDGKTADSLRNLGLPQDGDELAKLVESHWKELKKAKLAGKDEAEKRRRAFVVVLERAIGAELEGKLNAVLEAAVSS